MCVVNSINSFMKNKVNASNLKIDLFINAKTLSENDIHLSRKKHLEYSLEQTSLQGSVLEFGVFEGTTINIISEYFANRSVWGFDSFEGLPEDWITDNKKLRWPKGHFKVDNLPIVNKNVKLVKGWFDETLSKWINDHKDPISFLHIDCDLYSSTNTILTLLNPFIKKGTIIVFDELYHWSKPKKYTAWKDGEYKALAQWLETYDRNIEILSRSNYMQATIKVL
jgi:hypothetical protein